MPLPQLTPTPRSIRHTGLWRSFSRARSGLAQLSSEHFPEVRLRLRQAGENLRELAVGEAEVALQNGRKYGAVVGRHGEVAALVELRLGEARPVAVDAAAVHTAA